MSYRAASECRSTPWSAFVEVFAAVAVGTLLHCISPAMSIAGGLAGTIRDASTGLPIAGIDLDLFDASFSPAGVNAVSGVDGTYLYSPLPAGQYFLRADPSLVQGYVDQYHPGVFLKSDAVAFSVPEFGTTIVDFSLETGSTISGTITSAATSLPVSGLDLDVYDVNRGFIGSVNTRTGIDGSYMLGQFPAGSYFVRADPETTMYQDTYYLDKPTLASADPVLVDGATDVSGIDFSLTLAGFISGFLTDAMTGAPLDSLDLDVFDLSGQFLSAYDGLSAADGSYLLGPLPPGDYLVQADPRPDQFHLGTYYGDVFDWRLATAVSVSPGVTTAAVDIALEPGGTIAGLVVAAADGSPLPGLRVSLFDSLGSIIVGAGSNTGVDGAFLAGAVPSGSYFVRVMGDSLNALAFQFYPGVNLVSLAQPVTVAPGLSTTGINFALAPGGWISGTVFDGATNFPLDLVDLDVYSSMLEFVGALDVESNPAGAYLLGPVPAGQYLVRADPPVGSLYAPQYYYLSSTPGGATQITMAATETIGMVDFYLGSAASGVSDHDAPAVHARLLGARPNPFNPRTQIAYELDRAENVRLSIHDLRGRKIVELETALVPAGRHVVTWDGVDREGRSVASGVYFARLVAGSRTDLAKLMLVR